MEQGSMVAGLGLIVLHIDGCRSLKEKRAVVRAMIARLRNAFNASVAEVGLNDLHRSAHIGIALVGNDVSVVNARMDQMFNAADQMGQGRVIDTQMEIFTI
ncbi:MAG: DUF503 domain-containing protein [Thermodesulfobacteriota bacterium]|nr:DUF503 domain-containing protein [Thermodesulfobacteriota bacterium]